MLGVLVNAAAIAVGSLFGVLVGRHVPKKVSDSVMTAIGLCVAVLGLSGCIAMTNALVCILSLACGAAAGTLLDLDGKLTRLGEWTERRLTKNRKGAGGGIADGFVSGTLLYCIGSMAIVGSLQSGLDGNHTTLFTKSLLDGISSVILSVSCGIGVALSAVSVFLYQGTIVLLAGLLRPLLSEALIAQLGAVGSLLIVLIGTNLLGITKVKTANFLPAVLFPPLFLLLFPS